MPDESKLEESRTMQESSVLKGPIILQELPSGSIFVSGPDSPSLEMPQVFTPASAGNVSQAQLELES